MTTPPDALRPLRARPARPAGAHAGRSVAAALALAACAAVGTGSAPVAAGSHGADAEPFEIGIRAVEAVYRPLHGAFARSAGELDGAIGRFCDAPSAGARAAVEDAWSELVPSFAAIEPLRVGPLLEDNRINRVFFWPDSRRAGERQLRALLAETAPLDVDALSAKSVAVQGLPALERLLVGLADGDDPERACRVARPAAANVRDVAEALDAAWRAEDGIARRTVRTPSDDPLFRTRTEVLRSLLTQLQAGLESLAAPKLGPVAEADARAARALPFARSGHYGAFLRGNVDGLAALLLDAGIADAAEVAGEAKFEIANVRRLLAKLDGELAPDPTLRGAVSEEAIATAGALRAGVLGIERLLIDRIAPALGTGTGFNSADGD